MQLPLTEELVERVRRHKGARDKATLLHDAPSPYALSTPQDRVGSRPNMAGVWKLQLEERAVMDCRTVVAVQVQPGDRRRIAP